MLMVAIVPTAIHSYIGSFEDDGLRVEAVSTSLAGFDSAATDRNAAWVKDTYDSHDWMERRYTGPEGDILLFAARSYNLKRLYHHPEIGVLRGVDLKKDHTGSLQKISDVPVHVLKGRTGKGLAAYVLLYDGQFVQNPLKVQVLSAIKLLFSARRPMTLFMVYDSNTGFDDRLDQSPAARVLKSAVDSFLSQNSESSH
jgi:hypothetical protein